MSEAHDILFSAIGGGSSIGGSSYLIRVNQTVILIDFGIAPEHSPQHTFEELTDNIRASKLINSWADISAVVLTHAHTDHCGLLPALFRKLRQELGKGKPLPPFYASEATKQLLPFVYQTIQSFDKNVPFSQADIDVMLSHIRPPEPDGAIDWLNPELGQLWFHPTSHLLGSVIVELKINNRLVIHTGDLRLTETPTLPATIIPKQAPDLLIIDGTYGAKDSRKLQPWALIRNRIFQLLDQKLSQRKVVLFPSFALGRSQDVLAIVLEHAQSRPDLNYYIYLDGQSRRVTRDIYPRFKHDLLKNYTEILEQNSWRIKWVDPEVELKELVTGEIDGFPAVVIASSGMLLPGSASRRWAEMLAQSPGNSIAFTGYLSEDIKEEIFDRGLIGARGSFASEHLGISGHIGSSEMVKVIEDLSPKTVIVVHCGGGDYHAENSILSWLSNREIPGLIGQEGKLFAISPKGILINDY